VKVIEETFGHNGILKITGSPLETVLFLKNTPIHYSWFAEIGTTWRYHLAKGLNQKAIQENNGIKDLLRRGLENEGDFLWAVQYFLDFLCFGKYEFGFYELIDDLYWTDIAREKNYESSDYYGGLYNLTPTQNIINDKLVNDYKEEILCGKKPVMVIIHIKNSQMFFILDGHHKFLGYKEAQVKPYAIVITNLNPKPISLYESNDYIDKLHCKNKDYINKLNLEKQNSEYFDSQTFDLSEIFTQINTFM
jgi:hypothetical protein